MKEQLSLFVLVVLLTVLLISNLLLINFYGIKYLLSLRMELYSFFTYLLRNSWSFILSTFLFWGYYYKYVDTRKGGAKLIATAVYCLLALPVVMYFARVELYGLIGWKYYIFTSLAFFFNLWLTYRLLAIRFRHLYVGKTDH